MYKTNCPNCGEETLKANATVVYKACDWSEYGFSSVNCLEEEPTEVIVICSNCNSKHSPESLEEEE